MTATQLTRLLVGGRLIVGGGALAAPRLTGRLVGIDPDANPSASYLGRLFGVRAVLMAALLYAAGGVDRERQLRAGVAVDVIDAAAAVAAGWRGELRPASATAACAAAIWEAFLGTRLLNRGLPARVNADTAPSPP